MWTVLIGGCPYMRAYVHAPNALTREQEVLKSGFLLGKAASIIVPTASRLETEGEAKSIWYARHR